MQKSYFSNYIKKLRNEIGLDAKVWLEQVSKSFEEMKLEHIDLVDLAYQTTKLKILPSKKYGSPEELARLLLLLHYPVVEKPIALDRINKEKIELGIFFAKKLFEKHPSVVSVHLTGSLLFGGSHYWSDVDLIVVHKVSEPEPHNHSKNEVLGRNLEKQYPFNPWISVEGCYTEIEFKKDDRNLYDDIKLIQSF